MTFKKHEEEEVKERFYKIKAIVCPRCEGKGRYWYKVYSAHDMMDEKTCGRCWGSGKIESKVLVKKTRHLTKTIGEVLKTRVHVAIPGKDWRCYNKDGTVSECFGTPLAKNYVAIDVKGKEWFCLRDKKGITFNKGDIRVKYSDTVYVENSACKKGVIVWLDGKKMKEL
jgi:DnaJ-class molecular chaperone